MDRKKVIIRTSLLGVGVNVLLAAAKAVIGLITNSIAILLDAVNNLSDVLSSLITIIGTAVAGKAPDRKHPFGHGRVEYITAVIVAVIVLFAGVTSMKESIVKLIRPEETHYTVISLIVLVIAIGAKLGLGLYVKAKGRKIDSAALVASGTDAFFDAILTLSTLVAAGLAMLFGLQLEGVLGIVISVFILKAGIEMLLSTFSSIIGERTDPELSAEVKELIGSFREVRGIYDLTLHNYGPSNTIGSVHIEVADDMTAREIHSLSNKIAVCVYQKTGIILTVGIYAENSCTGELSEIRKTIGEYADAHDDILQMHGFFGDNKNKTVNFDLIVDFKADAPAVRDACLDMLRGKYPDYDFYIILDTDYTD